MEEALLFLSRRRRTLGAEGPSRFATIGRPSWPSWAPSRADRSLPLLCRGASRVLRVADSSGRRPMGTFRKGAKQQKTLRK
eukprot:9069813-Pyramimonas_sp.AAC.1